MQSTGVRPAKEKPLSPASLSGAERSALPKRAPDPSPATNLKPAGYGLPCANCRAYYPADMTACPICNSPERASPTAVMPHLGAPAAATADLAEPIDEERERFLRELKSQAFASHTQINAAANFRCVLEHQHHGTSEPAAVCHTCYGEARQLADRLEAALHMDPREAAQIVYDAVWADPSDPNRTYHNAASALLTELRKRAGIGLLLGTNQPLAH